MFYGLHAMYVDQHNISQIQYLCTALNKSNTRAVIRVSGDDKWCMQTLQACAMDRDADDILWVSDNIVNALSPKHAITKLGHEYRIIIFDCRYQFDLDALGAVSGALCGGGLLFLWMPELDDYDLLNNSLYLKMIRPLLEKHEALYCLQQGQPFTKTLNAVYEDFVAFQHPVFLSREQQSVVEAIEKNIHQNASIPMVLLANRGRGKSSALGLAAARLIKQGVKKVLITAPRLSICECVFMHAQRLLKESIFEKNKLTTSNAMIEFKAPDALLEELSPADLLIVDEAAAIPLPLLVSMLKHYGNIIFSSTLYGYEGTGRGFTLKFTKILDQLTPTWQSLSMQAPIRWAQGDPLEAWIDELLCLHTRLVSLHDIKHIEPHELSVSLINKEQLIDNPQQLNDLFSLLVSAHYRTRPSDFQYLLDQPELRIYVLNYQQRILAAVVINQEGGFDKELSTDIYRGERRPNGHLLAQTLCFHAGVEAAAYCDYGRVMRIAVHPDVQLQGLGSHLMQAVIEQEKNSVDMLGASFAASAELLDFWQKQGFEIVRMGFTRDHVSASHSAIMLMPLANKSVAIYSQLRLKFQHGIRYWLDDALINIQSDIKEKLLQQSMQDEFEITQSNWQDIESFAFYHRGYEACSPALNKLVLKYADDVSTLAAMDQQLIDYRITKKLSWSAITKETGLSGKKQVIKQLRAAIARLLDIIR